MKSILLAAALLVPASPAASPDKVHWDYSGDTGPEHWAQLDPEYGACAAGSHQSPIDLSGFTDVELPPIAFDYATSGAGILNSGHAVQVDMPAGSGISIDGTAYALKQFHFHAPGEHRIQGRSFPMEAHLVHADRDGNLAVVAVMVVQGAANPVLAQAWAQMPQVTSDRSALVSRSVSSNLLIFNLSPTGLLPADRDHYRYTGSLTMPPCTEGVRWLVMKHAVSASKAQIGAFTDAIGHPNNRPVQALRGRDVLE